MFNTNPWLYYSTTSNKLTNTYIQGILDTSGNITLRNGGFSLPNGDVSMNGNLYVGLDTTMRGNVNIQGYLVVNKRVLQTLNNDPSYNAANGYYALAKQVQPIVSKQTAYDIGQNWQITTTGSNISWTSSNGYFYKNTLFKDVCWCPKYKMFCAVESVLATSRTGIYRSYDGINWIVNPAGYPGGLQVKNICWSEELELFVCCGDGGTDRTIMYSSDGSTWNVYYDSNDHRSISWIKELGIFVAVKRSGTVYYVVISYHPSSWTQVQTLPYAPTTYIIWARELSLACVFSNGIVMIATSKTLNNFTVVKTLSNCFATCGCWSSELGLFCMLSSNGIIFLSKDGYNWDSTTNGVPANTWTRVCWAAEIGMFCAVANTGANAYERVIMSRDGYNWITSSNNSSNTVVANPWVSICWAPELSRFCAVANSAQSTYGDDRIMTSNVYNGLPTSTNIKNFFYDSRNNINVRSTASGSFPRFGKFNNTGPNLISIGGNNYQTDSSTYISGSDLLQRSVAIGNTIINGNNKGGYAMIGMGQNIFPVLTTGFQNIGIGNAIATTMTTGHNNVFIGNGVATSTTSTGNTVAIGTNAGSTNITGVNNTYLGALTGVNADGYRNSTALGYGATITASNQIKLGTATETINIDGNLIVSKTIETTNLTVSGTTSLISGITLLGNLIVNNTTPSYNVNSGSFQLKGGAGILGNVFINQNLSVAQNSTFSGNVSLNGIQNTFTGDVSMNGNLQVNRTSIFNGNVLINGNIIFTKDVSMNGNLGVGKNATVGGDVSMNGNLYVGKNSTFVGNVSTSGFSTLKDVSMNGNISVSGQTTLVGNVNIQGNLVVNKRVLQTLSSDPSYNTVNGYYELAKDVQPIVSKQTAYDIGQNWVNAVSGVIGNNWYSICWSSELVLFCAVAWSGGKNDRVMVSSDGLNWRNAVGDISNNNWATICWAPQLGLFCAVANTGGTNDRVMVSSDGLNWSSAASNGVLANEWYSICWAPELGLFCVVGITGTTANQRVMLSRNGLTWSSATSGVLGNNWYEVCWAPELGLFCAVAASGTTNQRVMVSSDGYNWRNANSGVINNNWFAVCWSPELGLFCAVSTTGGTNDRVMVSSDGLNWRSAISGVLGIVWTGVCWSSELGLFCAVAQSGGTTIQNVMVSSDGLNWRNANTGVSALQWNQVCWSPELSSFCAVAQTGTTNQRVMITNPVYRWPTTKTLQTLLNDGNYNIAVLSTASGTSSNYGTSKNIIKIGNNAFFDLSKNIVFNENWNNVSTSGNFNWIPSANITIFNNNSLRLYSQNSLATTTISSSITYNSVNIRKLSFIVSTSTGLNIDLILGFYDGTRVGSGFTNRLAMRMSSINANNGPMNIFAIMNNTTVTTLTSSAAGTVVYLLEMEVFTNYIIYSYTDLTNSGSKVSYTYVASINQYNGKIGIDFYANTATTNSRYVYIDNISWVVSSDEYPLTDNISIGSTNTINLTGNITTNLVGTYNTNTVGLGNNVFPALINGFQNFQNIGIGNAIATSMTTGYNNVFIGNNVATYTTSTGNTVAIGTNAGSIILPATTILHYPFNNDDCLNYASGIGVVNGTLQGAQISKNIYKVGTGSLSGNSGIANNYFSISSVPQNNNGYSFSFWIYMNVSSWTGMAFTFDGGLNNRIFAYVNGGIMQFATGITNFSTITIPVQTWTHFAWTITTGSASTIYVNGSLYTTTTTIPYISSATFTSFRICGDPQGNQYGINGYLDDFRYFDGIITPSNVQSLFIITSDINNTYLGAFTGASLGTYSNSTAIGYGATIVASNEIVLGTLTEQIRTPGNPYWLSSFDSVAWTSNTTVVAIRPGTAIFSNRITVYNTYYLLVPEFAYGLYLAHITYNLNAAFAFNTFQLYLYQYAFANATTANVPAGNNPANSFLTRSFETIITGGTTTNLNSSMSASYLFTYAPGTTNRAFTFGWLTGASNSTASNDISWNWITIHKVA